jgi:DnaJ family protein C protein 11
MQEPLIDDEEDALELPDLSEGLSYYQLLNLDADCSTQDVVKAHRALAVALHPDKQDEQHREIAEAQFRRIQRAYEVLVDPRLRAVYDVLGEEGLSQKWDVGQKLKSPAEMRADFENQVRKRKIDELENLVRTKVGLFADLMKC